MSDLVRILLEKLLGWAQGSLYRGPPRSWQEIDGIDRFGRLMLIVVAVAIVVGPLGWFLFK